mmetsp:Transcript_323/g.850  ORF Transcript_323/g.850 Transcript_323/m.850 type:complete len:115 (+) Transcript_323:87-431(+)|eukprot:CAMPEP_0197422088 /NCGR_PEP_ID=MMETSP1170-20131217/13578_1 /TAXON_ID=54406 /ORGANISM="Sarcinochrysis sp, Strain CCMP770" /LENGTH=114 /DNA_ID=CAMNT_0042949397 /DNA_START=87 /DNA_END=431 /DNA_ORIENTATION=-
MAGYNPNNTRVQEDTLATFLRQPVGDDLQAVPGIGPANARIMAQGEDRVETVHQLIGKFLSFKGPDVTPVEHCDAFYHWLQAKQVNAGRNNIVLAIAEKVDLFIPGVYDSAAYD